MYVVIEGVCEMGKPEEIAILEERLGITFSEGELEELWAIDYSGVSKTMFAYNSANEVAGLLLHNLNASDIDLPTKFPKLEYLILMNTSLVDISFLASLPPLEVPTAFR